MGSVSAAVSQGYVRFAGCCYLIIIGLGLYAETLVRASLVVAGDAVATAAPDPEGLIIGIGKLVRTSFVT